MSLAVEESRAFHEEVMRFVQKRVLPSQPRHDEPLTDARLEMLVRELGDLGLLPTDTAPELGLWTDMADVSLTLTLLTTLAEGSAELAFTLHHTALARFLLQQLKQPFPAHGLAFTLTGHYGLARLSLGRWLAGKPLQPEDTVLLADWLDHASHPLLLCSAPACDSVLWPVWQDASIQWQGVTAPALELRHEIAHGLDALAVARGSSRTATASFPLTADASRTLYARLLKMEWLGLTAIALGVARASAQLAFSYAKLRRQGGTLIGEHAAVQIMLAELRSTLTHTALLLQHLPATLDTLSLADAASLRWQLNDALLNAVNQVIQIHGGIGYMRDTGPEKHLRNMNMLRQLAGGVASIPLFIEGLSA